MYLMELPTLLLWQASRHVFPLVKKISIPTSLSWNQRLWISRISSYGHVIDNWSLFPRRTYMYIYTCKYSTNIILCFFTLIASAMDESLFLSKHTLQLRISSRLLINSSEYIRQIKNLQTFFFINFIINCESVTFLWVSIYSIPVYSLHQ